MTTLSGEYPFRCVLSLEPLLDFWNGVGKSEDSAWTGMPEDLRQDLEAAPELSRPIEDLSILRDKQGLLRRLMAVVFPEAFWESEAMAAVVPFVLEPVLTSAGFRRAFVDDKGAFTARLSFPTDALYRAKIMRAYFLILKKCYNIDPGWEDDPVHLIPDPETMIPDPVTGLERYYKFKPDFSFVQVHNVGGPEKLTEEEQVRILDNLTDPNAIREILPPENFEFRGFTVIRAVDITKGQVMSALDRDLVDTATIVSQQAFMHIQERLRTLFKQPDLTAGLAAIRDDQAFLLSSGCEMKCNCIYGDSEHVSTAEFAGSVYQAAVERGGVTRIRDIVEKPNLTWADREIIDHGLRALLVVPLEFRGDLIGILKIASPRAAAFRPGDELLAKELAPMFSMALKRALEKLDNDVDALIKKKCTAVHPSVEWRFRKAVMENLEGLYRGHIQEMAPIVFKDVYPLYGATDIRGSSDARNGAIRDDLEEHLELAGNVIEAAWQTRSLPVLREVSYRLGEHRTRIEDGVTTGEEMAVTSFLHNEVEPLFPALRSFGPRISDAIATYEQSVDPVKRTVYSQRRDFEQSVSLFNERLASYLDAEEAEAQTVFPHYFDKRQTDGLDYVIYLGASMVENGDFHQFYVRNLRIWQIMVACGLAWHANQLERSLKVPLRSTHLILVNHNPLAIRFRFDEKRFDVDGAYNIGHEIVRSRIDKAVVKGRRERLTQPEHIAMVYSRPEEAEEMLQHVKFLQAEEYLLGDVEHLELDDLPGVKGLKALRVAVDIKSGAVESRIEGIGEGSPAASRRAG